MIHAIHCQMAGSFVRAPIYMGRHATRTRLNLAHRLRRGRKRLLQQQLSATKCGSERGMMPSTDSRSQSCRLLNPLSVVSLGLLVLVAACQHEAGSTPAGPSVTVPVAAPPADTAPAPEPAAEPEPAPMTSMGAGSVDDFECPDPVDNALERLALAEDPRFARVTIGFEPSFFQAHQGIVRVARRNSGMLATCVTEAAQLSEATSMVDVEWRVDSNGQVADLRVTASNFAASTVPRCAACLLTTLSFPRPDDLAGTAVRARLEYRSVAAAQ